MGKRYKNEEATNGQWSRWIYPHMEGYKMACCDCGLVHVLEFRVCDDEPGRIEFRCRRDQRATGQVRRHKKKGEN